MKGLQNLGNTCYMNAALQMLLNNEDFCKLVLKYSPHSIILNKIGEFITSYYSDNNNSIVPSDIKKIIEARKDLFVGYAQQDSTEFIVFFLDIIDTEIKKIDKNSKELNDIFGIQTNTRTKCKIKSCLNISNKMEINNILLLDIESDMQNLNDAYRNYKSGEKMEGNDMYYCDKCKEKRVASKRYSVEKWSPHIIVWLKRFRQTNYGNIKMNQKLDIPLEWRHDIKLKGAVIHYGNLNGGHYVYVGKKNDKWYIFDDSSVSIITNEHKLKDILCHAYCLYYTQ
jgi:ubiquitin C-terminal hydrolase